MGKVTQPMTRLDMIMLDFLILSLSFRWAKGGIEGLQALFPSPLPERDPGARVTGCLYSRDVVVSFDTLINGQRLP